MSKSPSAGVRRSVSLSIALVAALVLVFAFSVSAFAADFVVDNGTDPDNTACVYGSGTFTSIQAAVTTAVSGDTIKVCDGNYVEFVDFGSENMTLLGESQQYTVISGTPSGIPSSPSTGRWAIDGTGAVYVIKGITVVGPHFTDGASGRGIKLYGAGAAGSSVTLENVTVLNSQRSNIDLHSYLSVSLTNVTARDAKNGVGIALTDIGTTSVSSITTSGNAWGGVALYTARQFTSVPVISLTFAGTNTYGEPNAFQIELDINGGNYHSAKGLNFAGSGLDKVVASAAPTSNVWNFVTTGNASAIYDANLARYGNAVGPIDLTAGMVQIIGKNGTDTIGAAITAATAGDTIFVGSGTFAENITVAKQLRLIGIGNGSAPSLNTILHPGAGSPVVSVNAVGTAGAPVLLKSLRVEPVNQTGVYFADNSVSEHVTLDAVNVVGSGVAVGEVEFCINAYTASSVKNLTITNSSIEKCEIGLAAYVAPTGGASCPAGVKVFDNVLIENTRFLENGAKGLYIEKANNLQLTNVVVDNNGNRTNAGSNPVFNAGIDINLKCTAYSGITLTNVHVLRNGINAREGMGVGIKARDDASSYDGNPASLTNVTITGGSIIGNQRGLRVGEPNKTNATPAVAISGTAIHDNKYFASTPSGTPSAQGDVINWTNSAVTGTGVFTNPDSVGGYVEALISGTITITPNGSAPTYSVSVVSTTSLQNTAMNIPIRVTVKLDGNFASNAGSIFFKLNYPSCLSYQSVTHHQQPAPTTVTHASPSLSYLSYSGLSPWQSYQGGPIATFNFLAGSCATGTQNFTFEAAPLAPSVGEISGYPRVSTFNNGTLALDLNLAPSASTATAISPYVNVNPTEVNFARMAGALRAVADLDAADSGNTLNLVYSLVDKASCSGQTADDRILFTVGGHPVNDKLYAVRSFTNADTGPYYVCVQANDQRGGFSYATVRINLIASGQLAITLNPTTQNAARRGAPGNPMTLSFNYATSLVAVPIDFDVVYDPTCIQVDGGLGGTVDNSTSGVIKYTNVPTSSFNASITLRALSSCDTTGLYKLRIDKPLAFANAKLSSPNVGTLNTSDGTVHVIYNSVRGDCNAVGMVDASDLTAIALEIFDADSSGNALSLKSFLEAPFDQFAGSPYGCDANGTGYVSSDDLSRAVQIIFNETVTEGPIQPAAVEASALQLSAVHSGSSIALPITFASNGNAVNAIDFSVHMDPATAMFDETDANSDGIPDALRLNVPGMLTMTKYNEATGELRVLLFGYGSPLPTFQDGMIATVYATSLVEGDPNVTFTVTSAGGTNGLPTEVKPSTSLAIRLLFDMFLPLIQ